MLAFQLTLLLIVWVFGHYTFFPSPVEVMKAISSMNGQDNLIAELVGSFILCLKSMLYATIISCIIAYISVIPFFSTISNFITKFRFLTMVGLTFFFEMASSDSSVLRESLLTFAIVVFFTTGFISTIKAIPGFRFDHARVTGLGPWRTLWRVVIKGRLIDLMDMIRQNFAMAWMMLTMVEGLERSGGGLGVLLLQKQQHLELAAIVGLQIIVLLIGMSMDFIIGVISNQVCPYAKYQQR